MAPVTVVVGRRAKARPKPPANAVACPLAPRPSPPGASPEATAAWLRRAVGLSLTAHEAAGTEGVASVLAGRLDDGVAHSLRQLRDSGRLACAIQTALYDGGREARPDVPLERIIRSALRRHELRPWLTALRRGWGP